MNTLARNIFYTLYVNNRESLDEICKPYIEYENKCKKYESGEMTEEEAEDFRRERRNKRRRELYYENHDRYLQYQRDYMNRKKQADEEK